jgi:uncharacterized protein (TIGR00159 family)
MSSGPTYDPGLPQPWLTQTIDIGLVLSLIYIILVIIADRRTLWMVRGFIVLMLASAASKWAGLRLLSFALDSLVIGSAVSMAVILQQEFRRFLEKLGRGDIKDLFQNRDNYGETNYRNLPQSDNMIDEIVDAVKELSQNRTGALIIIETDSPLDDRDFSVAGTKLNAEVSKELLQTIFQPKTILHDGAVVIRSSRIATAGAILPLSEAKAAPQLGTRHRAAMGITERLDCICVVVSEETGSISLGEKGVLNRPLTSSKLKELLEARLSLNKEERSAAQIPIGSLGKQIGLKGKAIVSQMLRSITRRQP